MNALARFEAAAATPATRLPIGRMVGGQAEVSLDLGRLLAGRLLIQGSSGAGKSQTLRHLVEEAFEYVTVMLVDPEGEFGNVAAHIGATTVMASEISTEGLTATAARARRHRIAIHLDLSDLEPDERISKAAAFFAGLLGCPREDWAHTVLVAIDEAHLLAPHVASAARDVETRRLGVATLTELCARGRKRGIAPVIATQRLAKLATSVTSELHNALIGLNVFDRDIVRAADMLGFGREDAQRLRELLPGDFFAFGPALATKPVLIHIGETITEHLGATPELLGPSDTADAGALLNLAGLRETGAKAVQQLPRGGGRALDAFLMDGSAGAAVRIIEALRVIAPNATTADDLAKHHGVPREAIDAGLDLLAGLGAVDTMPRGETRIARLSPRLRLRGSDVPVVGLS